MQPLYDRVVLKTTEVKQTKGGVIIPETAGEMPEEGEVVAVGPGYLNSDGPIQPLTVKVGDKVLFEKYNGKKIKVGGEDQVLVRESDIIAIL